MNDSTQKINTKRQSGFTLVELMVVAIIIGILGSIAYPAYMDYIRVGNRSDGKAALQEAAARLERFYSDNNTYAGFAVNNTSPKNKYTIANAVAGDGQSYDLTATPAGWADATCGALTLASTGAQGAGGDPDDCWQK